MTVEFDIKQTIKDMLGVVKQTAAENWKEVKGTAEQFLSNRKERLKMLADFRICGEIDDDKFLSRMEDEKLIFEAELNAISALSKAVAQRAVNAAIDVFTNAVHKAVDSVI